jgi:outer membrane protein assembly factor BamB
LQAPETVFGGRTVTSLVLLALLAACEAKNNRAADSLWATDSSPSDSRRLEATQWDTLWVAGGTAEDTLLLKPTLMSASDDLVYVYDSGSRALVAIDAANGRSAWRFGRNGAGPNEFRGVRDLKVVEDGGVYVLDPRNNRIVQLDRRGEVRSRIPLDRVGHAEQMAPLGGGRVAVLTMSPDSAFVIVDGAGHVQRRFSLPWRGFAALHPIARQGWIAASRGRWAFGFGIGDGWFAFRDTAPEAFVGRYIEHTEFPETTTRREGEVAVTQVAEYNACSACSLSLSGSTLYVHFGGYEGAPKATLDEYDVGTGRYLRSRRLPVQAMAVEVVGDRVYALAQDPYPVLLALSERKAPD